MKLRHIAVFVLVLSFNHSYTMKPAYYMTKNKQVRSVIALLTNNKATLADIDEAEKQLQAMENANKKTGHRNRHTEKLREDFEAAKKLFHTKHKAVRVKRELKDLGRAAPAMAKARLPRPAPVPRMPHALENNNARLKAIEEAEALMDQISFDLRDIEGRIQAQDFENAKNHFHATNFDERFETIRKMIALPLLKNISVRINKELIQFSRRIRRIEKELLE